MIWAGKPKQDRIGHRLVLWRFTGRCSCRPARPRMTWLNPTRYIARRRHAGSVLVAFWLAPRAQVARSHLVRSMARVDLSAECKSGFLFMKSLSFDLGQET